MIFRILVDQVGEKLRAQKDADRRYMQLALSLGRRGLGRTWPNPAVGAVVVKDGIIVGRGWTQPGGRPHAEPEALRRAGDAAKGATLYVTLEPCSHFGKSPPCVDAVIAAGISRVVSAIEDPNPEVAGQGHAKLRAAWGVPDPPEITMIDRFQSRYHGKRYSFGYPACPDLADQATLFRLLDGRKIGVELTEGYMMDPEASVSALVLHHPQARYFAA